jgi:hypothetical protein
LIEQEAVMGNDDGERIAAYALLLLHELRSVMEMRRLLIEEALVEAGQRVSHPFDSAPADLANRALRGITDAALDEAPPTGDRAAQVALVKSATRHLSEESGLKLDDELVRRDCEWIARRLAHDEGASVHLQKEEPDGSFRAFVRARVGTATVELATTSGLTRREAIEQLWDSLKQGRIGRTGATPLLSLRRDASLFASR